MNKNFILILLCLTALILTSCSDLTSEKTLQGRLSILLLAFSMPAKLLTSQNQSLFAKPLTLIISIFKI
jgi:hypothetical protein